MKLTIFGSTDGTGRQVVSQALDQGHEVTAFARSPEKLDQKLEKLKVVKGDVIDFAMVDRAIQGQGAVLCVLGMPAMNKSMLRANGTKNIIRAMEKAGVRRFICQSALGVSDSRNLLPFYYKYLIVPLMLRHVYADHEIQENYIKESQLDWIIARPAILTDDDRTGSYEHGFSDKNKAVTLKISRADVADFMLKKITDDT